MYRILRFCRLTILIAVAFFVCRTAFCSEQKIAPTSSKTLKFDFGSGPVENGSMQVTPETVYSAERGFGFLDNTGILTENRHIPNALKTDSCSGDRPFLSGSN